MMARRSGRRRKRSKSSGKAQLLLICLVGAIIAATLAARFAVENPGIAMSVLALLIAAFGGALFLRYRVIQANRRQFLAANTELAKVDLMSGPQFEHLVAERMIAEGFRRVRERGGSGDGGVDITAVAPGGGPYAVQCKRYSRTVGAPEVRNFSWGRWPTPSTATPASSSPPATSPARPARRPSTPAGPSCSSSATASPTG
jgi:restriction system protein